MTNYATNMVVISGPSSLIRQLKGSIHDDLFDFNKIIPCPSELFNMASPLRSFKTQEEVNEYSEHQKQISHELHPEIIWAVTTDEKERLLATYGACTRNDWNKKNWGVKWIGDISRLEQHGDTQLLLVFDTPSQEPQGIFNWIVDHGGSVIGGTSYEGENEFTIYGTPNQFSKYFTIETSVFYDGYGNEYEQQYLDILPDIEWD